VSRAVLSPKALKFLLSKREFQDTRFCVSRGVEAVPLAAPLLEKRFLRKHKPGAYGGKT
jgi:hypothetical protein